MLKYDIEKVVGEGSFGKALLCRRKSDKRRCIIKQISLNKMSRKEAKQTEQESTLLARLQHPNIVAFWESFHDTIKGSYCIVMEYADGGDLAGFIKARKNRNMNESQVLQLFVQIALAMKHVHDRKILHRDLKSQNIFLTSTGMVKLGDFGIARVLRNTAELASTQIGTPYFMSPEIMENKKYNSKSDIWSLGCVLYELAALKVPFDGASMKQLIQNIIRCSPSSLPSSYSKELRELVKDMLAKNPKDRPGITAILSRPVVRERISTFLNETQMHTEFSHTILHGEDVLKQRVQAVAEANARFAAGAAGAPPLALPSPYQPTPAQGPSPAGFPKPAGVELAPRGTPSPVPNAPPAQGGAPRVGAMIRVPSSVVAAAAGVPSNPMLVRNPSPRDNNRPAAGQVPAVKASPRGVNVLVSDLERIRQEAKKNGLALAGLRAKSPRATPAGGGGGGMLLEMERLKMEAKARIEAEKAKERERELDRQRIKAREKEREDKLREWERARKAERDREEAEERQKERERERLKKLEKEKELERLRAAEAKLVMDAQKLKEKEREKERERAKERERQEQAEIQAARRLLAAAAAVPGPPLSTPPSATPSVNDRQGENVLTPRSDENRKKAAMERVEKERAEKRLRYEQDRAERERLRQERLRPAAGQKHGAGDDSSDEDDMRSVKDEDARQVPPRPVASPAAAAVAKKADGDWLAGLQNQMGNLQAKVEQLQVKRVGGGLGSASPSPRLPVNDMDSPYTPAPLSVVSSAQPSPRVGNGGVGGAVELGKPPRKPSIGGIAIATPPIARSDSKVGKSPRVFDHKDDVISPSPRGSFVDNQKAPAKEVGKMKPSGQAVAKPGAGGGGRAQEKKSEAGKRKKKSSEQPVDSAALLAERKQHREQERSELRNFLKEQRKGAAGQFVKKKKVTAPTPLDLRPAWVGVGTIVLPSSESEEVVGSAFGNNEPVGFGGGARGQRQVGQEGEEGEGEDSEDSDAFEEDDPKYEEDDESEDDQKEDWGNDDEDDWGEGDDNDDEEDKDDVTHSSKDATPAAAIPLTPASVTDNNSQMKSPPVGNNVQRRDSKVALAMKPDIGSNSNSNSIEDIVSRSIDATLNPLSFDESSSGDRKRSSPEAKKEMKYYTCRDEVGNGYYHDPAQRAYAQEAQSKGNERESISREITRRMGAISRGNVDDKKVNGDEDDNAAGETEGLSFASEDLTDIADGPINNAAINDAGGLDSEGRERGYSEESFDDDGEEEEEALTEEAALEYSLMLMQMQNILEFNPTEGEVAGNDDDDAFEDDEDELMPLPNLLQDGRDDAVEGEEDIAKNWLIGMAGDIKRKGKGSRYAGVTDDDQEIGGEDNEGIDNNQMDRNNFNLPNSVSPNMSPDYNKNSYSSPSRPMTSFRSSRRRSALPVPERESMTVYGLPLPLSKSECQRFNINEDDTPATRMEAIRVLLEDKLGVEKFVKAYRFLKAIEEDDDDEDILLLKMESIVGTEGLQYLDTMFQLISIEERFEG